MKKMKVMKRSLAATLSLLACALPFTGLAGCTVASPDSEEPIGTSADRLTPEERVAQQRAIQDLHFDITLNRLKAADRMAKATSALIDDDTDVASVTKPKTGDASTDCADKADGWWCLGASTGFMVYCAGGQISGGCACASCSTGGVKAGCGGAPPPAACPP